MIMISHQHQRVVVPCRPDLTALFPHAETFEYEGIKYLSLPHGIDETRLLRNLDFQVPAPITEHYNFPGRDKPFLVQIKTAAAMTMQPRFYCLNGMGTGKTRCALWAYDWLRKKKLVERMLVVAPVSTMDFTWRREILQTLPGANVVILHGTRDKRLKLLATDWDIAVINHDGLAVLHNELIKRRDIDVVVVDEVAMFRNARAKRSKIAKEIIFGRKYVWGMTGSPTPNEPVDAYGLCSLITPDRKPRSFVFFRQEVMTQVSQFKWVAKRDAAEKVAELLQPAVRFSLDDVTELPDVIERQMDVPQGKRQLGAYKELKDFASVQLLEGKVTAVNGGVLHGKLLQASAGYLYMDDGRYAVLDNEDRLEVVLNVIEDQGYEGKTIVFSPWIHSVDQIEKFLTKERIEFATVTGSTPMAERTRVFNLFQNTTKYQVLNAHPGCMSHGLTLTAADTIIWFAPIASLETFEQANARIRRVGQRRKQQIIMLQGTFAERQAYQRLFNRQDFQGSVLDILADITKE